MDINIICDDILETVLDLKDNNFDIEKVTFNFEQYKYKDLKNACELIGYKIKKSYTPGYYKLFY